MSNVLISGGNRGIGLELCRQYRRRGETVFATSRQPSPVLEKLGVSVIEGVDLANDSDSAKVADHLDRTHLDILISNAGVLNRESLNDLDFNSIRLQFEINTLGPLRLIHGLLGNLSAGSKVGIITSRMGSIEDNGSGGMYGYRLSKAAANMAGRSLAHDLADRQIPVMLLHPGMVATDMTGGRGIAPADAAGGLISLLDGLDMTQTGTFWHAEGYQLPW